MIATVVSGRDSCLMDIAAAGGSLGGHHGNREKGSEWKAFRGRRDGEVSLVISGWCPTKSTSIGATEEMDALSTTVDSLADTPN